MYDGTAARATSAPDPTAPTHPAAAPPPPKLLWKNLICGMLQLQSLKVSHETNHYLIEYFKQYLPLN